MRKRSQGAAAPDSVAFHTPAHISGRASLGARCCRALFQPVRGTKKRVARDPSGVDFYLVSQFAIPTQPISSLPQPKTGFKGGRRCGGEEVVREWRSTECSTCVLWRVRDEERLRAT